MRMIEMDGSEMKTKVSTHSYIKKAMGFPEYYGGNLDALWDLLSSITLPTTIRLEHREALIENLGGYGESLIEVFREAALENESLLIQIE